MERGCCRVSRECIFHVYKFPECGGYHGPLEEARTWAECVSERGLTGSYASNHSPHTLPPQSLYLAHLAPYLASTQSQLETKLQSIQIENEQLAKGVERQRDEVERLVSGLEAVIADLEGANSAMSDIVEGSEIRKEAMELDGESGVRARGSRL